MSFLKGLWKGIKKVGGFIGKVVVRAVTGKKIGGQKAPDYPPDGATNTQMEEYYSAKAAYEAAVSAGAVVDTGQPSSSWLDFLNGTRPVDLNRYVTLPTVPVSAAPGNILLIGGAIIAAVLLLRKKH